MSDSERPQKRFKRDEQKTVSDLKDCPCFIKNIPRDILSEVMEYWDIKTIFNFTITCSQFNNSNLWSLITKLELLSFCSPPIRQVFSNVDVNKLTKLTFEVDRASKNNYLSALLRFTNVMSLGIDIKSVQRITFILSNFPVLRDLATKTIHPASFAFHQGKYLTGLVAASFCHEFDARHLTHFQQLQMLKIPGFQEFRNADSIAHLTCLTSLTVDSREISESDFEALCRHTQLQYFKLSTASTVPMHSITSLCNLTTLECGYLRFRNWTNILASLTALQRINIIRLVTDSFPPHLCSTLTHLAYYRSTNQSPVFHLTALQSLDISTPSDPTMYVKFSELPRLTELTFWMDLNVPQVEPLGWTVLTQLSLLKLHGNIDEQQLEATKRLMPSVRVTNIF